MGWLNRRKKKIKGELSVKVSFVRDIAKYQSLLLLFYLSALALNETI